MEMKFYKVLSIISTKRIPDTFKVLGLIIMHILRRRTLAVYLDPNTGCNLRCRMCYFSNPKYDKQVSFIEDKKLKNVERCFYPRALKLQIGCGTEPTLYPNLNSIITKAKMSGVPFISLTTNGQLLAQKSDMLDKMILSGLNEITLSVHGFNAKTYEFLMQRGKFEKFKNLLDVLAQLKEKYPHFSIRINFTFNYMNIVDLYPKNFWKIWSEVKPDVIQLRPVQVMGGTGWTDYDTQALGEYYDDTIGKIIKDCHAFGIKIIAPEKWQLSKVDNEQGWASAAIEDVSYCYVSPTSFYKSDFLEDKDTYESYHKRKKTVSKLLLMLFYHKGRRRNASKKLNYTVK